MFLMISVLMMVSCEKKADYSALIITGPGDYHDWQSSYVKLQQILENSPLFDVDVKIVEEGKDFAINFSDYNVVVMDYEGKTWPENTKSSFEEYMKNGGGLVVYHGSSIAFPDWPAYNEMTGLGGWADRDENSGPYLYWEDGKVVRNNNPGKAGGHPPATTFMVETRNSEHPITDGLPTRWLHAEDELYSNLRGPAKNIDLLATAYCDTAWENGTGKNEPVLFTVNYENGRVFHTTLGHEDAIECAGFIVTFLRGAEWAASGTVTQEIPVDFPNSASTNTWKNLRPFTDEEMYLYISKYKVGTSTKYLNMLKLKIRDALGKGESIAEFEDKMLELLQSDEATTDCKIKLCTQLGFMGSKGKTLPVLEKISQQAELKEAAQLAIAKINGV